MDQIISLSDGDAVFLASLPLIVDLDDTLVRADTLHEQVVRLAFHQPHRLPAACRALLAGRASLKAHVAEQVPLDPTILPYREELLQFIRAEKRAGRRIVLCTAAAAAVAVAVGQHLGLFDEIISSDGTGNLKGTVKADRLANLFPDGFLYAGDSAADLAVWRLARGIVLVGASPLVARRARRLGKPIIAEFDRIPVEGRRSVFHSWARALRVHHWAKNALLLVPLVLAHQWFDPIAIVKTLCGLALLLAVTSSSYLINDIADLEADRRHWTKRLRPIASGLIPIREAILFAGTVLPLAILCAYLLSVPFGFALSAYLAITLAYSFGLKRIPLLDTFLIGVLFTTRLVMGMALLVQPYSEWLITFSMFFFFSLATAKRHVEVLRSRDLGTASLRSRGYQPDDAPLTLAFGVAAALGSLLIMVLYIVEDAFRRVTYEDPVFLWTVPFVLAIWVGRIWLLAHRGELNDDPVSFALRDKVSLGLAGGMAVGFLIAL